MSSSPPKPFMCVTYTGLITDTHGRVVVSYDAVAIEKLLNTYDGRAVLNFNFDFSEQAGRPLYVLAVHNSGNRTFYGFFNAEKTVEFAKAVLPLHAQMRHTPIPSYELCDKLEAHFSSYLGMARFVNFCRKCHVSPAPASASDLAPAYILDPTPP